jgi:hypothetical protein
VSIWDNFLQYGGMPFGSLAPQTGPGGGIGPNTSLRPGNATVEDMLNHNSMPNKMAGNMREMRAQAMMQLGAGMMKNNTANPVAAFGGALSDVAQQGPENAYRQMQMQSALSEMEDRRRKQLRETQTWNAIDSDKAAPSWARISPEAYVDYNKSSASAAASQRIFDQFSPMLEQGDGSQGDVSGSDIGSAYDPNRIQQLYHQKAQAELMGNNNLAQALGAEITRMQSAADLGVKQQDLDIKRQDLEWKTGGEDRFKQNQTFQSEALKARSAINTYQKLHQLTQSPDFYSGPYAGQVMKAKQIASALGIDPNGVRDIESFKALSNDAIRQEIGSLGTGVSNADVLFLSQANANLDFTPQGNRQLVEIKIALAQRKVEVAEFAREYKKRTGRRYLDEQFDEELAQWAEENPIFPEAVQDGQADQPANTQQLRPGQTATNPQTGQKMLWDGRQWRPMQ